MVASSSNTPPHHTQDLTGVVWQDKRWLSIFPLDATTALDYFSLSQFYDDRCNNQLIKMQQLDSSLLNTMSGIEYALSETPAPNLFIITKSLRALNPPSLTLLATYYIHDGAVYQAPSIHAILSSRILQSVRHLKNSFETMQKAAVLSKTGTYVWQPAPVPNQTTDDAVVTNAEAVAMDQMLYDILHKNNQIYQEQNANQTNADGTTVAHSSALRSSPNPPPNPTQR